MHPTTRRRYHHVTKLHVSTTLLNPLTATIQRGEGEQWIQPLHVVETTTTTSNNNSKHSSHSSTSNPNRSRDDDFDQDECIDMDFGPTENEEDIEMTDEINDELSGNIGWWSTRRLYPETRVASRRTEAGCVVEH
jgi:hypothetical protein